MLERHKATTASTVIRELGASAFVACWKTFFFLRVASFFTLLLFFLPKICLVVKKSITLSVKMGSTSPATALLPYNFVWGFATASYQIEGAVNEDGRGKSIWDTFCHLEPTRTKGASGDVACDHYHRYEEDFDLLSKYGAKAYRFSISWSRIIPDGGRGDAVNEQGIAFYNRLIDSLLSRGIVPWVTLYHWDLPQTLHDRYGGWLNVEESQLDFERYARICYERFGDRVKNWITLNEPWIISIFVSTSYSSLSCHIEVEGRADIVQGYSTGGNAPGRSSVNPQSSEGNSATEPWIVGKALILSHARAVALYNREFRSRQNGLIGISLNGDFFEPWDARDDRDHEAAERRMDFHIGWFANPVWYVLFSSIYVSPNILKS